ncbi:MAG: hypothetical protein H6643_12635 [Caldilineaceae bacterium]|nr:hypothetical protein [Caldilineaceae bacterium]
MGNQQKTVPGCWLATTPKLLILDELNIRYVDVGARPKSTTPPAKLAAQGVASCSSLPEFRSGSVGVGVSHRRQRTKADHRASLIADAK